MPDSEIKSDLESASRPRNKHTRWHSLETPLSVDGASTIHSARRSIEATWFGRPKWGVLVSDPREVVEVAKVFGRMVRAYYLNMLGILLITCATARWVVSLFTRNTVPSMKRCYWN